MNNRGLTELVFAVLLTIGWTIEKIKESKERTRLWIKCKRYSGNRNLIETARKKLDE